MNVIKNTLIAVGLSLSALSIHAELTINAADLTTTQRLAQQGYAAAQNNLGVMYDEGKGVPQNDAQAEYWLQKAQQPRIADAKTAQGATVAKDFDEHYDYAQAVYWNRKATNPSIAHAQYDLAVRYQQGKGVRQDLN